MFPTKCQNSHQVASWPSIICWWALLYLTFTTTTVLTAKTKTPAKIGDKIEKEAYALYYTIIRNPEAYTNLAADEQETKDLKSAIDKQTMDIVTAAEKIKKELHAAKKGGFWLLLLLCSIHSLKNDL
jgi:5'(3')-deoxyribonucleotidase